MNKQSKRTLWEGIFLLILLTGVLVVYLNWTYARVQSDRAQITISNYSVGTDYAGIITKQYVVTGDNVQPGQPLFKLKSDQLAQDLASGRTNTSSLIYPLDDSGQMVITASKTGTVSHIDASQGSFIAADKQIATIADTSTLGVTADFTLGKSETSQLAPSSQIIVTLLSHQQVSGRITSILQSSKNGKRVTTIEATLTPSSASSLISAGSGTNATLVLNRTTYYSRLLAATQNLLSQVSHWSWPHVKI